MNSAWRPKKWLTWRKRRRLVRRLSIAAVLAGILVVLWTLVNAGEIYEYQDTVDGVHLPQVDAIVVLSGGRGRIAFAGDIWYRYWELANQPVRGAGNAPLPGDPPLLLISGMGPQSNWTVVTRAVRRGVTDVLRPEHVILERESANTAENAQWAVRYARERGWSRILLITSRYHMLRSRYVFARVFLSAGVPTQVETLSVYQEPFEPGEWRSSTHGIRVTVWEYLKWLFYSYLWRP